MCVVFLTGQFDISFKTPDEVRIGSDALKAPFLLADGTMTPSGCYLLLPPLRYL